MRPTAPHRGKVSTPTHGPFVGPATGLAVRLSGIGPRPCLTSLGLGSALLVGSYRSQPFPKSKGPTGYGRDGYSGRETTGGEVTIPT